MQNFKSIVVNIAILWKYCNTYCKISQYYNKYFKISKVLQYFAMLLEPPLNTRYLIQSHDPLTNLLKKALHIELYNEKWFNKLLPTPIPPFTYQHDTPNIPTTFVYSFPSVIKLHKDTHTCPPQPLFEKLST